jgi:hypothetical protein
MRFHLSSSAVLALTVARVVGAQEQPLALQDLISEAPGNHLWIGNDGLRNQVLRDFIQLFGGQLVRIDLEQVRILDMPFEPTRVVGFEQPDRQHVRVALCSSSPRVPEPGRITRVLLQPIVMALAMNARPPSGFLNTATHREGFEEAVALGGG